jgi:hypothetical protein
LAVGDDTGNAKVSGVEEELVERDMCLDENVSDHADGVTEGLHAKRYLVGEYAEFWLGGAWFSGILVHGRGVLSRSAAAASMRELAENVISSMDRRWSRAPKMKRPATTVVSRPGTMPGSALMSSGDSEATTSHMEWTEDVGIFVPVRRMGRFGVGSPVC